MITNPARVVGAEDDDDQPVSTGTRNVYVKKFKYPDPDTAFDKMLGVLDTRIVNVDAKLVTGMREGRCDITHFRSLREMAASPFFKDRIRKAYRESTLKEVSERVTDLVENEFRDGRYADEGGHVPNLFRVQDAMLPSTSSPYAKQMLFADYLDMHRKAFDAATRNPIAKRIVDIVPQFVLGRGVAGVVGSQAHQQAWDEFWLRNRMRLRLKGMLRELLIYGEVFNRYFRTRPGLVVRQLDPATIWDVYTDQDDIENVHFYHQQYVILNTLNIPGGVKGAPPSTLIIRQIPGDEIDHFKINSTSSEKRGRSQLFAVLGYLQRFREFANDRVLLNKMRAMFALDVSVEGGPEDLAAAESQFTTPPGTGSVLVHNAAVSVEFKNANNNANEAKTDGELLLKIIAIGAGVSEQFLGVTDGTSRAGALIQTEPDVKNFESYQELVEEVLTRASVRVFKAAGLTSPGQAMEFTFPAIAQEDRSSKLKDIAFAEAMDYFTKERSAAMVAREFQITTYDYGKERAAIQKERQEHPVIATGLQQVEKIAPAQPSGESPGLGADLRPALSGKPLSHVAGEMGFSAKALSGRGTANTQATLNRTAFTRGGEKRAIQNNHTSGTPLRHAAVPDGPGVRRGWTEAARAASLATRRRKKELREAALKDKGLA